MSAKKYLVTGGTGFIGSALVHALVKAGKQVRVLDNQSRGASRRIAGIEKQIEFIEGDIRNPETVEKAAAGVDSVLHLAFVNGTEFFYSKPELVLDVGVKGMVNVLDACIKHSIPELVVASSSEVYQEPPRIPTDESVPLIIPDVHNPRYSYAAAKMISEVMALNYGKKFFERVLIFRPHNVYGPDMGWEHVVPQFVLRMNELCAAGSGKISFPIQGSGEESRSFVYIDDFTSGLMTCIEKGEHLQIYHIGTTDELTIKELAQELAEYFGREIEIIPGQLAKGGTSRRCPDISKLAALGYKPAVSLKQGLKLTADWYCRNKNLAPASTQVPDLAGAKK
ncbi:MAG: SDR family NAD(P)-dependent oxidoreductase [Candidatus Obscuribacterales bacterium]|nr:SDR family NAD(P)-dependent oxidoreductase [Candidatus Obscuribacterales bacterium]